MGIHQRPHMWPTDTTAAFPSRPRGLCRRDGSRCPAVSKNHGPDGFFWWFNLRPGVRIWYAYIYIFIYINIYTHCIYIYIYVYMLMYMIVFVSSRSVCWASLGQRDSYPRLTQMQGELCIQAPFGDSGTLAGQVPRGNTTCTRLKSDTTQMMVT